MEIIESPKLIRIPSQQEEHTEKHKEGCGKSGAALISSQQFIEEPNSQGYKSVRENVPKSKIEIVKFACYNQSANDNQYHPGHY